MWEWTNFESYMDGTNYVPSILCNFLNENNIKDFKIIRSERDYIEIVYFKEQTNE